MNKALFLVLMVSISHVWAATPDLEFHPPAAVGDAATPKIMRDLAERLLPVYEEADPNKYLANVSALQMVAGDHLAADVSRQELRDRRRQADTARPNSRGVIYDIYAHAKAIEEENNVPFAEGFARAFHEVVPRFNDQDAYAVTRGFAISPQVFRDALQRTFDRRSSKDSIDQSGAMDLIWTFLAFDAYRTFGPLIAALNAEDDQNRYIADDQTQIKTAGGASVTVLVVRPKKSAKSLPTLLEFTIYDAESYAKECAAHGYAGVVAYSRGMHGAGGVVPFQHEGDDARAVIKWIARQSWSDGRVGMYGDGYSGFAAWAAAKRLPPALKAIAVSDSMAPGIDFPMLGSIFHGAAYRWSLYATGADASDTKGIHDDAQWQSLQQKWYRSGGRYRDLGRLNGRPNPTFIRWLNHPSYDEFWQKLLPDAKQFARLNIPVLSATGYYAAGEPGTLYYFAQHHRHNPRADHTLIIGPYVDGAMQRGAPARLPGLQVDSSARIDLHELRYQWFDHVLKDGPLLPLLRDRVNYEVTGANRWRHAASLEDVARESLKFYLDANLPSGGNHRLTQRKPSQGAFVRQTVSLADRTDADWTWPRQLTGKSPVIRNAVMFSSEPLTKTADLGGLIAGRLDFTVNKMDMDIEIMLYERLASGEYVRLFDPNFEFRASYAADRTHRRLLKAGERQQLSFQSDRMTSRRLQVGSRLVLVLGISKRPDREINYGTGNDVSEESIADGKIPIKIKWYGDSYVDLPVR